MPFDLVDCSRTDVDRDRIMIVTSYSTKDICRVVDDSTPADTRRWMRAA